MTMTDTQAADRHLTRVAEAFKTRFILVQRSGWHPFAVEVATLAKDAIEAIEALEAALAQAQAKPVEGNVWQPMETAPKDRKHILLCLKSGPFFRTVEGCFSPHEGWIAAFNDGPVDPIYWAWKPTGFVLPASPEPKP